MNAKYLDHEADRYDAMKAQQEAELFIGTVLVFGLSMIGGVCWFYVFTRIGLAWWGGLL
jgi:hypothetical protein